MFLVIEYFHWHYGHALKKIFTIGTNYILFFLHFFSIPLLFKTMLRPWKKDHANYGQGFDPQKIAQAFMWNLVARFLGAIVRSITILIGMGFLAVNDFIMVLILLLWIFWPLILLAGLSYIIGIIEFPIFI